MVIIIIITFTLLSYCIIINKKYKIENNIFYYIIALYLILLACFRDGNILYDYDVYVESFIDYDTFLIEQSFYLISLLIHKYLSSDIFYMFATYAILAIYLKFHAIKKLSYFIIPSILVYFSNYYIAQELIQIRSGVAAGFCLLSIKSIYERKLSVFIIYLLLACFFHTSAILFSVIWFLNPYRINKLKYITLLITSYIISFFNLDIVSIIGFIPIDFINSKFIAYKTMNIDKANIFSIAQLIKIITTLSLLIYSKKLTINNKYSILLLKIMIISLISLPLFSSNAVAGNRIRDLFGIVEIILFPMIILIFKNQNIGYIILIFICMNLFIISLSNLFIKIF